MHRIHNAEYPGALSGQGPRAPSPLPLSFDNFRDRHKIYFGLAKRGAPLCRWRVSFVTGTKFSPSGSFCDRHKIFSISGNWRQNEVLSSLFAIQLANVLAIS